MVRVLEVPGSNPTCSLSFVGVTAAVTRAQLPPAATGFGAKAHGVVSLLLPAAESAAAAPRVMELIAAVAVPPSLLLLKLGSWVINLRGSNQHQEG